MQEKLNKTIEEMTTDELLRQQLELLAERSKDCSNNDLCLLTHAMAEVYRVIGISL